MSTEETTKWYVWHDPAEEEVAWRISKGKQGASTDFCVETEAEAREGARNLNALEAKAKWADEVARPALEQAPCHWAIPCADMRAMYRPDHEDCDRCAALKSYPQPTEEV